MFSNNVGRRLTDIVENADRIATYLAGLDEVSFAREQLIVDATERCLERIAEAVLKIGAERMASIAPDVPFERVRGLGNLMRHAYDEVDLGVLFRVLKRDVAALRTDASRELDRN